MKMAAGYDHRGAASVVNGDAAPDVRDRSPGRSRRAVRRPLGRRIRRFALHSGAGAMERSALRRQRLTEKPGPSRQARPLRRPPRREASFAGCTGRSSHDESGMGSARRGRRLGRSRRRIPSPWPTPASLRTGPIGMSLMSRSGPSRRAAGFVLINPLMESVRIPANGTVTFQVVPRLSLGVRAMDVTLMTSPGGDRRELHFAVPKGKRVYMGLGHTTESSSSAGSGCSNQENLELDASGAPCAYHSCFKEQMGLRLSNWWWWL